MFRKIKALLYFLAGVAFWEAFVHLDLRMQGLLPLTIRGVIITPDIALRIALVALAACIVLLLIAYRMDWPSKADEIKTSSK